MEYDQSKEVSDDCYERIVRLNGSKCKREM